MIFRLKRTKTDCPNNLPPDILLHDLAGFLFDYCSSSSLIHPFSPILRSRGQVFRLEILNCLIYESISLTKYLSNRNLNYLTFFFLSSYTILFIAYNLLCNFKAHFYS